ncbi:response regulator [Paenibacillus sp. J5C_2022]|uniref:response regulator n=1 Tax=Paenibacillus sp. J5C2022 TaxID=2977129 RepID=UPI0021D16CAD|nr:response regulator [Paenibacillus sp. J5C2022]MCU6709589.1 response regulator [Paenibacillus sp. J5C2022]
MTKIRCLIVDDEAVMIQRLTFFFDSISGNECRFELVGSAYSGDEGLQAAARLRPDIVITDIKMPGMDGITMIERMKESMPDTEFIILTAYQDFNYAKRAIHIHVADFIVKVPLNEEVLLQAMNHAAERIMASKREKERLFKLNMSVMNNRHRVFKQFFLELLRGEIKAEQAAEISLSYDLQLFQNHYCCMVIELNGYFSFVNQYPISDQKILKYGILNVIEETLLSYGPGFACEMEQNRFIAFASWPHSPSKKDSEEKSMELARAVIHHIRTYMKQSASLGISGPFKGWEGIMTAYKQALDACAEHYYNGMETIVTPMRRLPAAGGDPHAVRQHLQESLQMLYRNMESADEIKASLLQLKKIAEREMLQREAMTSLLKEFMLAARHRISQWKIQQTEEVAEGELLGYMTLAEQLDYVICYIEQHLILRDSPGSPAISKALEYIDRNLTERLTLQMIAAQANLAPAYFSSLFKKEMKESLVDYINRKKMEKAVELLKCENYSNYELCEAVGIMNESYFCTLFKQKTGSTPGKFRKQTT